MKRCVGTVDICGVPFKVYVADERGYRNFKPDKNDRATFGECDYVGQAIYLNVRYSVQVRRETLSHEMLHGIWPLASVNQLLRMGKTRWTREELVINTISPYVLRAEASASRLDLR